MEGQCSPELSFHDHCDVNRTRLNLTSQQPRCPWSSSTVPCRRKETIWQLEVRVNLAPLRLLRSIVVSGLVRERVMGEGKRHLQLQCSRVALLIASVGRGKRQRTVMGCKYQKSRPNAVRKSDNRPSRLLASLTVRTATHQDTSQRTRVPTRTSRCRSTQ